MFFIAGLFYFFVLCLCSEKEIVLVKVTRSHDLSRLSGEEGDGDEDGGRTEEEVRAIDAVFIFFATSQDSQSFFFPFPGCQLHSTLAHPFARHFFPKVLFFFLRHH